MNCPVDGERLALAERNGVEIDDCPACRGIWLDRGELDRITAGAAPPPPRPEPARDRDRFDDHDDRHQPPPRKKRSFLDLLDLD